MRASGPVPDDAEENTEAAMPGNKPTGDNDSGRFQLLNTIFDFSMTWMLL